MIKCEAKGRWWQMCQDHVVHHVYHHVVPVPAVHPGYSHVHTITHTVPVPAPPKEDVKTIVHRHSHCRCLILLGEPSKKLWVFFFFFFFGVLLVQLQSLDACNRITWSHFWGHYGTVYRKIPVNHYVSQLNRCGETQMPGKRIIKLKELQDIPLTVITSIFSYSKTQHDSKGWKRRSCHLNS